MDTARRLAVDQRISMKVTYQETAITTRALIRRRTRNRVGVMLIDAEKPSVPLHDPNVEQLVRALEREWLRNRLAKNG
jgi:hypothetical protein